MNKKMKLVSVAAAMAMAASMSVSAFAAAAAPPANSTVGGAVPTDNGTEVWAGVAVDNPDMRIKVTVPTLFAFVVNGSVDATEGAKAVTAANGGLLLPNVKVENVQGTGGAGDTYDLTTTGDSALTFDNYSTYYSSDDSDYRGLAVKLSGSIKNETGGSWTHIATKPSETAAQDLKKYRLSVNGQQFTAMNEDGSFGMATPIDLNAPENVSNTGNLDGTTKLAKVPTSVEAKFGVEVGGTRGDYQTAENSAKVGTIVWKVSTQRTVPDGP